MFSYPTVCKAKANEGTCPSQAPPWLVKMNPAIPADKNWYLFNGHCYFYSMNDTVWDSRSDKDTFQLKEEFCRGFGGHLLSIQGEDEYNFVKGKDSERL